MNMSSATFGDNSVASPVLPGYRVHLRCGQQLSLGSFELLRRKDAALLKSRQAFELLHEVALLAVTVRLIAIVVLLRVVAVRVKTLRRDLLPHPLQVVAVPAEEGG